MPIKARGPLFDGTLNKQIEEGMQEGIDQAGDLGLKTFKGIANTKFKNPTGKYVASLNARSLINAVLITDGGLVYGPPLERGHGSFGGYHIWEDTSKTLDRKVSELVEAAIAKRIN